ncbi:MAG: HDIG domain-containing protein [Proteobacteria bacterium]|nr:HDIG domain-containing protein [Pseudomonadota bacterium]
MDRDQALALLERHASEEYLVKHSLATEVIMRALAERLGHDPETWGLTGLLHDLDYDQTKDDMVRHGLVTAEILHAENVPTEITEAIKSHNAENLGLTREKPVDFALTAAETITGLIVAATLVYPDKRIASVKAKSVRKRMKEPRFAANVNRDHIVLAENLGLTLDEFIDVSLTAMKSIGPQLGL